jgi:hypothetical protein
VLSEFESSGLSPDDELRDGLKNGTVAQTFRVYGTTSGSKYIEVRHDGTNGRVAFGSDRYGGTFNIFTMNPDGSGVRQLTFLHANQGAALDQTWSPDGSRLVFEKRNAEFIEERRLGRPQPGLLQPDAALRPGCARPRSCV